MKAYSYTAFTADGAQRKGLVVAETETDAASQLSAQGLYVADLAFKENAKTEKLGLGRRAILNDDLRAVFTRQMAVLLGAEMPVEAALDAVRQGGHKSLDTVAARARARLMDGATLSESLAGSGGGFAAYYLASVQAGENAGHLGAVFNELATHLETQGQERAQISTALLYPAFVAAVSLLVCGVLMVNVAPEIVDMFAMSDRPLPQITQVVIAISDLIQSNFLLIGLGILGLVVLSIASARIPALRHRRDRLACALPMIGRFMRLDASVQYLRTLSLVLASKSTVPNAVENATNVLTVDQFHRQGEAVSEAVRRGESLSQALLHLKIIPPVARQLIQAGEASVRLAPMTDRAAQMVENGLATERKRIAAVLEPLLMMLIGAFVLVIVLAVLLPIFDLQSVVSDGL
ncbi:type II secretion system protein GspF [Tateyamaria omphalii]|uniref:type II secretion system F family protein n=1 Tax=Tateyamaria omphalii TaxID=299262 RepID=UPI00167B39A7|nr:type II secretion system F family protein [Tateyamaria omphalii]GGX70477.1 type II secretion system protein GspF [Tateyamaria omphalii]